MKLTLVPVTDTDEGWRAFRAALMIARRFEGHADAVFVHPEVHVEVSKVLPTVDQQLRVELADRAREQMASHIRQAHNTFDEIVAMYNVADRSEPSDNGRASASWEVVGGQMPDMVGARAGVYDALIFSYPVGKAHDEWRPSVETALFAAGRPILLAPRKDIDSIGETVLVGWNRTAQSARAMISAMPFLKRAGRLVILSIATGAKEGPTPQAAARQLAWHGITAEVEEIPHEDRPVAETLLAKAQQLNADLVVMGAYSHNRFREVILGGVTQHVLRHAEVPVLLAH